jgi:demethylmenaquinone methyltransferase/2-methoxy-6-polyprenyl-1,4-benzoquinol methylase
MRADDEHADSQPTQAQVLGDQAEYYRERAGEYDDWFFRRGRYDRGPEASARWFAENDEVQAVLERVPLDGAQILELAPGTGLWTRLLCPRAQSIVAVDASPEMVELNRERLGACASKVTYVIDDLFSYTPTERFDAVVFAFWISHVPEQKLPAFAAMVASTCRPGSHVVFVDGLRQDTSTAVEHRLPEEGQELMVRKLDDGRQFTIVKSFRSAAHLEGVFAEVGISMRVRETATYFQYGVGQRGA